MIITKMKKPLIIMLIITIVLAITVPMSVMAAWENYQYIDIITELNIGIKRAHGGAPINTTIEQFQSLNDLSKYEIRIEYYVFDNDNWREAINGEILPIGTQIKFDMYITAREGVIFSSDVIISWNVNHNVNSLTIFEVIVNQKEITLIHAPLIITETSVDPVLPPVSPTYHTIQNPNYVPSTPQPTLPPIIINPEIEIVVEIPNTLTPTSHSGTLGGTFMQKHEIVRGEASALEQAIIDLFGEYEPIASIETGVVTEHIVTVNEDGETNIVAVSIPVQNIEYKFNWNWAAGVALFGIVLYSFFRCIGGVLKWK